MKKQFVTLTTAGTRGDVQPAIALGQGLQRSGYAVRVVAFEDFRSLVNSYGLEFFPTQVSLDKMMARFTAPRLMESGTLSIRFVPKLLSIFREMYQQLTRDFWQAAQGSLGIIGNPAASHLSRAVAEKLGIPYIETSVFPPAPTRSFPSVLWPRASKPGTGRGLRGTYNLLTYRLIGSSTWLALRPIVNRCREEVLNLPPIRLFGKANPPVMPTVLTLAGFSEHVIPRPVDWEAYIHVTGFWFVDTHDYTAPDDLAKFLEAGLPPVYIGFGSMPSEAPGQMAALVSEALHLAGQRGLLYTGQGGRGLQLSSNAGDVLFLGSTPHDWLFPRMAAVVHHGGAGTTAAGLRAGVPSVLVPMLGDQHLWGQCVASLGVGPRPIPRPRLTAERLAEAITQAVSDPEMRQRASELSEAIRAEDGVGNAARLIQSHLGKQEKPLN